MFSSDQVPSFLLPVKCDFQDGLCGLKDDSELRWSIGSGSTPTKNTGPDYDHSTFLPEGK